MWRERCCFGVGKSFGFLKFHAILCCGENRSDNKAVPTGRDSAVGDKGSAFGVKHNKGQGDDAVVIIFNEELSRICKSGSTISRAGRKDAKTGIGKCSIGYLNIAV